MERAKHKLELCARLAKMYSLHFRETKDKRYIVLRKEAMQDARYWKSELLALTA